MEPKEGENKPLFRVRPVPPWQFHEVLADDLAAEEIERRYQERLAELRHERLRRAS